MAPRRGIRLLPRPWIPEASRAVGRRHSLPFDRGHRQPNVRHPAELLDTTDRGTRRQGPRRERAASRRSRSPHRPSGLGTSSLHLALESQAGTGLPTSLPRRQRRVGAAPRPRSTSTECPSGANAAAAPSTLPRQRSGARRRSIQPGDVTGVTTTRASEPEGSMIEPDQQDARRRRSRRCREAPPATRGARLPRAGLDRGGPPPGRGQPRARDRCRWPESALATS